MYENVAILHHRYMEYRLEPTESRLQCREVPSLISSVSFRKKVEYLCMYENVAGAARPARPARQDVGWCVSFFYLFALHMLHSPLGACTRDAGTDRTI